MMIEGFSANKIPVLMKQYALRLRERDGLESEASYPRQAN